MKNEAHDPEWHLTDPRTKKWLQQCGACQSIGYKPDVPDRFFGRDHILRYFKPITLNEAGLCAECALERT